MSDIIKMSSAMIAIPVLIVVIALFAVCVIPYIMVSECVVKPIMKVRDDRRQAKWIEFQREMLS
jgi:hypothetical protein